MGVPHESKAVLSRMAFAQCVNPHLGADFCHLQSQRNMSQSQQLLITNRITSWSSSVMRIY